jgi:hypothetical protein
LPELGQVHVELIQYDLKYDEIKTESTDLDFRGGIKNIVLPRDANIDTAVPLTCNC